MKTFLLIGMVMIFLMGCADVSIKMDKSAFSHDVRSVEVWECSDGTYSTSGIGVPAYPVTRYPCEKGSRSIAKAVRSVHPKVHIVEVDKVQVGGWVFNRHTEYKVFYR